MRWTRQRQACDGIAGRIALRERYPARKTTALMRTAKARGPGTRCWCQVGGGFASSTGFDNALIRRRRWQKELSPGRARYKP
jgi:hypothetical protein